MNKIKIKHIINHASFVNHLSSAPPAKRVHNVVQNLPVGGHLKDF